MTRKLIFAANWKMNKGPQETHDFIKSFVSTMKGEALPCEVVIAPPMVSLPTLESLLHDDSAVEEENMPMIPGPTPVRSAA